MKKEEFVLKANTKHDYKYDYSKVEYVDYKTKVCIICPKHGEFWQKPSDHLQGKGCNQCNGGVRSNTKDFIEKAKKIHGDKYDYSKVEYEHNARKVSIICPIHGVFRQSPNNHLQGNGCPKCTISNIEESLMRELDILNVEYVYQKKIFLVRKTKFGFLSSKI